MDIKERALRKTWTTFFFIERLIWKLIWLEVLPDKEASTIEQHGVYDGLWYVSSSLYSRDRTLLRELDSAISQSTNLSKGSKLQIKIRKFITKEMEWFELKGKPAIIDFSCEASERNIYIIMESIRDISDQARAERFKYYLQDALSKYGREEDLENHYHQIVNRWDMDDYCIGSNRIPRLRAEITKMIRRYLKTRNFIISDKRMLLRGKILDETDNMARTVRHRTLMNETEFKDSLLQ